MQSIPEVVPNSVIYSNKKNESYNYYKNFVGTGHKHIPLELEIAKNCLDDETFNMTDDEWEDFLRIETKFPPKRR